MSVNLIYRPMSYFKLSYRSAKQERNGLRYAAFLEAFELEKVWIVGVGVEGGRMCAFVLGLIRV